MRIRNVLFVTAGVVGVGVGGAAIGAAINDPDVYVEPMVVSGVAAPATSAPAGPTTPADSSGSTASEASAPADDTTADDNTADDTVTVRTVDGLEQLVGTLRSDDTPDDWYVSGVDVDFGPDGWLVTAPAFADYDGNGVVEPLLAELRGLEGREVTMGVRYEFDDSRTDAYAFTIQGLPYRDPTGGTAPWQAATSGDATFDQIAAAAAEAVGTGAIVIEVYPESDDGWTGWEVDVRASNGRMYEVYVDLSGVVLDVRPLG